MGGIVRRVARHYDANGNRIRIDHPDGSWFTYEHDGLDRLTLVRENGGAALVGFAFDNAGRHMVTGYAGASSGFGYDQAGRLRALGHDLAGTSRDQGWSFAYNPASQVVSRTAANDAYAYVASANVSRAYQVNGLNQYTFTGTASLHYDPNGNLAWDGSTSFVYDVENRLVAASGASNVATGRSGRQGRGRRRRARLDAASRAGKPGVPTTGSAP